MYKQVLHLFIGMIFLLSCSKNNDDGLIRVEKEVSPFNEVWADIRTDLEISNGERKVVIATSEQEIQEYVNISVENKRLIISLKKGIIPKEDWIIKVYASEKEINEIYSTASKVKIKNLTTEKLLLSAHGIDSKIEGNIKCDTLDMHVRNVRDFKLNVDCNEMALEVGNYSNIELTGKADVCGYVVSESVIHAFKLVSKDIYTYINKDCTMEANVSNEITGTIMNRSKLYYKGNPRIEVVQINETEIIPVK